MKDKLFEFQMYLRKEADNEENAYNALWKMLKQDKERKDIRSLMCNANGMKIAYTDAYYKLKELRKELKFKK